MSFQNPPRVNSQRRTSVVRNKGHPFTWQRYHRYNDIVTYMHYLASTYPHLAQVLPIGTSSEGRPLYVLKVSSDEPLSDPQPRAANWTSAESPRRRHQKKPAIWIDAGTHAREWIGPAVAMYICMEVVERYRHHPHLVQRADWYIMPVLNPDGYEFSHTTDRLWRKSRSTHELASGASGASERASGASGASERASGASGASERASGASERASGASGASERASGASGASERASGAVDGASERASGASGASERASGAVDGASGRLFHHREPCQGVDLNRNWDFNWGERKGASDDPCNEAYAGPRPFSEPETRAVSNFILRRRERLQLFITLHSYSQMWLIPEDASFKHLPDHQEMYNKARIAVKALKSVRNTRYQIGTASEMLYTTSGCSDSWAKGVAGIKYSYTVELPDRGLYGFMLPANFIIPTGKETFVAFKELIEAIVCKR